MESSRRSSRCRRVQPCAEALESRQVLTGGAGAIFAVIPAAIGTPGGTVAVPFTIDPTHFSSAHGGMLIGIDVSGQGSPAPSPRIVAVQDSHGHTLPAIHGIYNRAIRPKVGSKVHTSAALFQLDQPARLHPHPAAYTVLVAADSKTSGALRVGFYLPGDTTGRGVVDSKDLQAIQSALGAQVGDPKYSLTPGADVNRDGRIDQTDVTLARRNLGVTTTVSPTLTGHPEPASAVDPKHRTTTIQDLGFAGTATPGATITVDEINKQSPEVKATVDATGNYHLTLHLAKGTNSFTVHETDAFGQNNTGVLPVIKYSPST